MTITTPDTEIMQTYFCIDGHTAGNPVRLVVGGAPIVATDSMTERRRILTRDHDRMRTALTCEPRGHGLMSGAIVYPACRSDCDVGLIYIETTGFLPMCGHVSIGAVTMMVERGLIAPRTPGLVRLDTPAGVVEARYTLEKGKVTSVVLKNVPAFVAARGIEVELGGIGRIKVDVAYGGNFYAIVEPQEGYADVSQLAIDDIAPLSRSILAQVNQKAEIHHPLDPTIKDVDHVLWAGRPTVTQADARNAVFYGVSAIDRSPCGTGTSARLAQLHARGDWETGAAFVHESIIGSLFTGCILSQTKVGDLDAVETTIEGSAWITGLNTLLVDPTDPYRFGFELRDI